jgi:hypothetical protein
MANGYALARGTLAAKTYRGYGNLGVLRATEIWDSATSTPPTGTVYRVRDSGIRCVGVAPCASLHTANLNTTTSRNITHLNLEAVPNVSSTATAEARGDIGEGLSILVSGTITTKSNRVTLTATQFYRPLQIPSA